MNKAKKQQCTGKTLLSNNSMGGHIEDYIGDPERPQHYPKNLQWVPVSQSFKKGRYD
jgi:hypothetical protein